MLQDCLKQTGSYSIISHISSDSNDYLETRNTIKFVAKAFKNINGTSVIPAQLSLSKIEYYENIQDMNEQFEKTIKENSLIIHQISDDVTNMLNYLKSVEINECGSASSSPVSEKSPTPRVKFADSVKNSTDSENKEDSISIGNNTITDLKQIFDILRTVKLNYTSTQERLKESNRKLQKYTAENIVLTTTLDQIKDDINNMTLEYQTFVQTSEANIKILNLNHENEMNQQQELFNNEKAQLLTSLNEKMDSLSDITIRHQILNEEKLNLENQYENLVYVNNELIISLNTIKADLEISRKQKDLMESTLNKERKNNVMKISELTASIDNYKRSIKNLESDVDVLVGKRSELETTISDLNSTIEELKATIENTNQNRDKLEKSLDEVKYDLKNAKELLVKQKDEYEQQIQYNNKRISELNQNNIEKLKDSENIINQLKNIRKELALRIKNLEKENTTLNKSLEEQTHLYEQQKLMTEDLTEDIDLLKEQSINRSELIKSLNEEIEKKVEDVKQKESELSLKSKECNELNVSLQNKEEEIKRLTEDIRHLSDVNNESKEQIAILEANVSEITQAMTNLKIEKTESKMNDLNVCSIEGMEDNDIIKLLEDLKQDMESETNNGPNSIEKLSIIIEQFNKMNNIIGNQKEHSQLLEEKCSLLENKIKVYENNNKELKNNLEEVRNSFKENEDKLELVKNELNQKSQNISKNGNYIKEAVTHIKEEKDKLVKEVVTMESEVQVLNDDLLNKNNELASTLQTVSELESKLQEKEEEMNKIQSKLEEYQFKYSQLQDDYHSLKDKSQIKIDSFRQRIVQAEEEKIECEKELNNERLLNENNKLEIEKLRKSLDRMSFDVRTKDLRRMRNLYESPIIRSATISTLNPNPPPHKPLPELPPNLTLKHSIPQAPNGSPEQSIPPSPTKSPDNSFVQSQNISSPQSPQTPKIMTSPLSLPRTPKMVTSPLTSPLSLPRTPQLITSPLASPRSLNLNITHTLSLPRLSQTIPLSEPPSPPPNPPPTQPLPVPQNHQIMERNNYLEKLVKEYKLKLEHVQNDNEHKLYQMKEYEEKIEETQNKFKQVMEEKDTKIAKLEEENVMSLTRKMIINNIQKQLDSTEKKLDNYKKENEFLRQRIKKMGLEEDELKKSMNQSKATLQSQINSLIEQVNQSEKSRIKMAEQLKSIVGDNGSKYYNSLFVMNEQIDDVEKKNENLFQTKNELEGYIKNLDNSKENMNI